MTSSSTPRYERWPARTGPARCRSSAGCALAPPRRPGPPPTTSANRHGELAATTAVEVTAALGGELDAVVEGGHCGGLASTIIDCTSNTPRVLREGPISAAALRSLLGGSFNQFGGAEIAVT